MDRGQIPAAGRFVEVAGGRLHYLEAGPAEGRALGTVVLAARRLLQRGRCHARPAGSGLRARYRVIAIDRPGHGWSDRIGGAEAAKPDRQAAILAEGLRKLGVSRAVVVGHSWGGAVTPNLALDHTDVTGAILQLAAVTHPWPGGAISWYYHPAASFLGWLFTRTLAIPVGWLLVDATAAGRLRAAAAAAGLRGGCPDRPRAAPAASSRPMRRTWPGSTEPSPSRAARYRDIRIPATVIGGDADRIVWTDLHSRSFARDVAGAKLVVLPGIGHMPHHAMPELVAAEIEALAAAIAQAPEMRSAL